MKQSIFKYLNVDRAIQIQFILSIVFGLFIIVFPFIFQPLDWEDYSITFNGTWLMYNGYAPYSDFGIPTGIGSFIFPYLSFLLFGPNYNSLYIMQAIEHGLLIYACYLFYGTFLKSNTNKRLAFSITIIILSLFVIFNVKAQFYNSEFLLFEIFSFVFVLRAIQSDTKKKSVINSVLVAFFVFLTLQVKQDYGVFNFLIIITVLLLYTFKNKNFVPFTTFIIFFSIFVGVFLSIVDLGRFIYWFNLGQSSGTENGLVSKLKYCFEKMEAITLLVLIAIAVLLFLKQNTEKNRFYVFPLVIICGFGLQNILTLSTSNFPYLFYAVAFVFATVLVQLFQLMKVKFRSLLIINLVFLFFLYFNLNQVYKSIYYFHPNGLLGTKTLTEKSRFKSMGISRNYKANGADFQYCINLIDSLYKKKKSPLYIANFTSLPFEMEAPTIRIKGLPLWPDNNVLLFEREKQLYLNLLDKKQFDLIFILELNFGGSEFTNNEFKNKALENYKLLTSFLISKYKDERRLVTLIKKS